MDLKKLSDEELEDLMRKVLAEKAVRAAKKRLKSLFPKLF